MEEPDASHGRLDQRKISVYSFEPLEAKLPGARSLVVIERTRIEGKKETFERAFYITSLPPEPGCAQRFGKLARGHWGGSEIRNHWIRDHCMVEDKSRSKNYKVNCVLAGLRTCVIVIKTLLFPDESYFSLQEKCQRDPTLAYRAVAKLRSK